VCNADVGRTTLERILKGARGQSKGGVLRNDTGTIRKRLGKVKGEVEEQ